MNTKSTRQVSFFNKRKSLSLISVQVAMTAFLGGVLTLGLEILAGRILAPYFGSSLHQWAALIGIVLLAYVVGYETYTWINRWGPAVPFFLGGVFTLSLPFWFYTIANKLVEWPLIIASIAAAFITTGIPSILWASVLPYLQKHPQTEKAARVLAWSTAGNLAGVWGIAFLGIPELGSRMTLIVLGGISLFLGALWIGKINKWARISSVVICLICTVFFAQWLNTKGIKEWNNKNLDRPDSVTQVLIQKETSYQQVDLWKGEIHQEPYVGLGLNGNFQFFWNRTENLTQGNRYEYYNYLTAAAFWNTKPAQEILVLGVAGGLIPWQIHQFLPQAHLTGFDLDEQLIKLAQEHLPLGEIKPPMELKFGDGRFLLRQEKKKYDLIIVDLYLSGFIPFHLLTQEFFQNLKEHLSPHGMVVGNFHSVFYESGLMQNVEKTLASVFENNSFIDTKAGHSLWIATLDPEESIENRLVEGTKYSPSTITAITYRSLGRLRKIQSSSRYLSKSIVLTDDKNNTEQLLFDTRKLLWINQTL